MENMDSNREIIEYKITVFINENEIFWIGDIRNYIGGDALLVESDEAKIIYRVIQKLRRKGLIVCSEKSKSEKQYMRIKLIENL